MALENDFDFTSISELKGHIGKLVEEILVMGLEVASNRYPKALLAVLTDEDRLKELGIHVDANSLAISKKFLPSEMGSKAWEFIGDDLPKLLKKLGF